MSEKIRLNSQAVQWRRVDEEIVALDLQACNYLAVNRTGAALWDALVDGATKSELVRVLVEAFDVTSETAARDVDTFVDSLREQQLLDLQAE